MITLTPRVQEYIKTHNRLNALEGEIEDIYDDLDKATLTDTEYDDLQDMLDSASNERNMVNHRLNKLMQDFDQDDDECYYAYEAEESLKQRQLDWFKSLYGTYAPKSIADFWQRISKSA